MTRFSSTLIAFALIGCGGAQAGAGAGDVYSGPNELDFLVTAPIRRQMPPERHLGSASVVSDDGETVTLELRMVDGGDACQITANRGGDGSLAVVPADCSSQFVYEESPTAATVSIAQGTVTLSPTSLSVRLRGTFVAAIASGSGASEVTGVAHWNFDGRR